MADEKTPSFSVKITRNDGAVIENWALIYDGEHETWTKEEFKAGWASFGEHLFDEHISTGNL